MPAGAAERDVHNRFERNGLPFPGCGLELPLTESGDGISVQLLVNALHQLNAVHGPVGADHPIQNYLALDVLLD